MKTFFFCLLFFCISYVGSSYGREENMVSSKVQVTQSNDYVFELHYMKQSSRMVQVKIFNSENVIVYSERLKQGRFIRPYNLNRLPEGIYILEVHDENGKYRHILNNGEIKPTSFSYVKFNPVALDQVKLTVLTEDERQGTIRVYDDTSQLLHITRVSITGAYVRLYTLKGIISGYIVVDLGDSFETYAF